MDVTIKYLLTMSPAIQKMSLAETQVLEVSEWALYTDIDSNGEEREILSIMTPENEVFATNSPTFKDAFSSMVNLFNQSGKVVEKIKVIGGESKAGRHFITCTLAI